MVALHDGYISLQDVQEAQDAADRADLAVAQAWETVEHHTRHAVRLEAAADRLRVIAERTALQVGFRKPQ